MRRRDKEKIQIGTYIIRFKLQTKNVIYLLHEVWMKTLLIICKLKAIFTKICPKYIHQVMFNLL